MCGVHFKSHDYFKSGKPFHGDWERTKTMMVISEKKELRVCAFWEKGERNRPNNRCILL
jgi:hypothetical protein